MLSSKNIPLLAGGNSSSIIAGGCYDSINNLIISVSVNG